MQMNASSIVNQKAEWEKLGVKLPAFDHAAMTAATKEHPIWVHFGAGNIFRGFIAALQQRLLNEGAADRGIIAADTFDYDIIDKIYTPYDNLTTERHPEPGRHHQPARSSALWPRACAPTLPTRR
mgnify:CR=1 FL=1